MHFNILNVTFLKYFLAYLGSSVKTTNSKVSTFLHFDVFIVFGSFLLFWTIT